MKTVTPTEETAEVQGEVATGPRMVSIAEAVAHQNERQIRALEIQCATLGQSRDLVTRSYLLLLTALETGDFSPLGIDPSQLAVKVIPSPESGSGAEEGSEALPVITQEQLDEALQEAARRAAEIQTLKNKFREAVGKIQEKHRSDIEEQKNNYSTAISDLREIHKHNTETLNAEHATELENLRAEHERAVESLKSQHEQDVSQLRESHDRAMETLESKRQSELAEAARVLADTHEQYKLQITKLKADHEEQINRERREAQEREDELKEQYRRLEESIPGIIKRAKSEGRDTGLDLAETVVGSAHSMGLDSLSSTALRGIRKHQ